MCRSPAAPGSARATRVRGQEGTSVPPPAYGIAAAPEQQPDTEQELNPHSREVKPKHPLDKIL